MTWIRPSLQLQALGGVLLALLWICVAISTLAWLQRPPKRVAKMRQRAAQRSHVVITKRPYDHEKERVS